MEDSKTFEGTSDEHQYFIDDQTLCCLCGTKLDFKHEVDYMKLTVREDADCPCCKIHMKTKEHTLQ